MRPKPCSVLCAVLLFAGLVHGSASAKPLLVFDSQSGSVITAEDAGKPWYPASLTKLMTSYIVFRAIREGRLTLDTKITVSANARSQPPSKIGLPVGSQLTVSKALEALIVRSANDIAVVLAEGVAGTEEKFIAQMNDWARRLGMTGTYFANPHGLPDPRQVTTARDMGLLARALIKEFPEHDELFTMKDVQIGKRKFRARNSLLREWEEADGMKTGFICASGYNLIASATREGRRLVAVILGAPSHATRTQIAKQALEAGFTGSPLGRNVAEYTNGGFFQRTPDDMGPVVCKKSGEVRIARASWVRGWGADFGRYDNAKAADAALTDNMLALRNVIYAGRGRIVRDHTIDKYAAVMSDLDAEQARHVCAHLKSKNIACTPVQPGTFKEPVKAEKPATKKQGKPAPLKSKKKRSASRAGG